MRRDTTSGEWKDEGWSDSVKCDSCDYVEICQIVISITKEPKKNKKNPQ